MRKSGTGQQRKLLERCSSQTEIILGSFLQSLITFLVKLGCEVGKRLHHNWLTGKHDTATVMVTCQLFQPDVHVCHQGNPAVHLHQKDKGQ